MPMKRQAGLTLLEMLVVLLISGMALALGFQTLGQWRRADVALSAVTGRLQNERLTRAWLQDSLRGLTPVEEAPFKGSESELSGTSLNPVIASQGGATPIGWRLDDEDAGYFLTLSEHGQTLRLPLPDVEAAHFSYLDAEGKSHPQWPPALGVSDALPVAIQLHLEPALGQERVWSAPIAGIRNPIWIPYEPDQE